MPFRSNADQKEHIGFYIPAQSDDANRHQVKQLPNNQNQNDESFPWDFAQKNLNKKVVYEIVRSE